MSQPATLTIRVSGRTSDRLDELAGRTRQAREVLAEVAIAAYVEHELAVLKAIEHGRTDVREGRVVPHEEVAREAQAVVAAARAARRGGRSSGRKRLGTTISRPSATSPETIPTQPCVLRAASRPPGTG